MEEEDSFPATTWSLLNDFSFVIERTFVDFPYTLSDGEILWMVTFSC